jgi:class 3 adenylate cyclase
VITGKSFNYTPNLKVPGFENIPWGRFSYTFHKALSLYLLKNFQEAKEAIDLLDREYPRENISLPHYLDYPFYRILIHFENYSLENLDSLEEMKKHLKLLTKYNKLNPTYFACRYYLCKALIGSINNETKSVVFDDFENAIESSQSSPWIEALSYEYFARFCENRKIHQPYAKVLWSEAYDRFKSMNAVCKIRHISIRKDSFSSLSKSSDSLSFNTEIEYSGNTTSSGTPNIDIQTIIKSATAITEDLDKQKLLMKLNRVIVENAGAEKGFIILKENEKFIVHSEVSKSKSLKKNEEITGGCTFLSMMIFYQSLNQRKMVIYNNAKQELEKDEYVQKHSVKSVLCAPIIKGKNLSGMLYLENNSMVGAFTESRKFILRHILSQVAISIENSNLFEDVKTINEAYARFLPVQFLNLLEKKDIRNVQPSESVEKKMTILFSDIRDFTSISDNMDAKGSFKFVNDILSALAPSISSNNGFVDKFIGDCVMAIFPESPLDGVNAGIQMIETMNELNKTREIPVNIGVGVAYGNVMIGTLGFEKRLDATVISSTVNTASRMESLTKTLGVNMIITEEVYENIKLSNSVECYFLGSFYLKGQNQSKKLFEILSSKQSLPMDVDQFNLGVEFFAQKKFDQAMTVFQLMEEKGIVEYYINVCRLYKTLVLPEDWKGEIKVNKDGEPIDVNWK